MALPKIVVRDRTIILLSGFTSCTGKTTKGDAVKIDAKDKLQKAAEQDPDAVAFGYVAGEWIASA